MTIFHMLVKGWFPYDRRRSHCDHMETLFCDRLRRFSQARNLVSCLFMNIFEANTDVSFGFEADVVVALGLNEEINCSKISSSISAMLFALIFPRAQRACTFDISAEMYGYSRLCDRLRSFEIIWKHSSASIFGKYLFGRRFEIYNFRNICCKISCLPASPRIFEHLKNRIIAHF